MDKKPLRKPVQLDLKTFKKLEKICIAERRGPGFQVAKLTTRTFIQFVRETGDSVDLS